MKRLFIIILSIVSCTNQVEINEDFADSLAENMEILINGHNTAIKDVNENRFRTNLTSVMLESEELDRLIYGSKVSIVLHKSQ